ncbi:MAG: hypothetical protein J0H79_00050 [Alphaproteobacteria bacterium]|nr:hypothetical protein [Alphaproteobacteria bacterium]
MARTDWRSASAYEELRPLDAPAFAYEFLRRNPEFLTDHARLARKSRNRTLDPAEAEAFAVRWGVRFQPQTPPRTTCHRSVDAPSAPERGDPDQTPR